MNSIWGTITGGRNSDQDDALRQQLRAIYPPDSEGALDDQLIDRPHWFRTRYIPWIEARLPLRTKRVLEVGSGTGASTVTFAEKGAIVTGIDLNAAGVDFMLRRAAANRVGDRVTGMVMNAVDMEGAFEPASFDLVIFTASLEHMTHDERIRSLASAWKLTKPGGYLGICDTPNRLWFFDNHTSDTNFFHWLPDDLAISYASRCARSDFRAMELDSERLARQGRGASYHELEIALGVDVRSLDVYGEWQHQRSCLPDWAAAWATTPEGCYHDFLKSLEPEIPEAFFDEELAVLVRKPGISEQVGMLSIASSWLRSKF